MFIQTEMTPNPATLKFLPGLPVLEHGTREFRDPSAAEVSPLATRLFGIEGVTGIFLGSDFVSVTKDGREWDTLVPAILGGIMEHYMTGQPVLVERTADAVSEDYDPADVEVVSAIRELIETRVRPAVAGDGGDIIFRGFRNGVVSLTMQGACSGCPSATATLRHGIENLLKHFVPEVQEVRAV